MRTLVFDRVYLFRMNSSTLRLTASFILMSVGKSFGENLALIKSPLFEVLTSERLFKEALRGNSKGLHGKFDSMIQPENLPDFQVLINNAQFNWNARKRTQQFEWKRCALEQTALPR